MKMDVARNHTPGHQRVRELMEERGPYSDPLRFTAAAKGGPRTQQIQKQERDTE